MPNQIKDTVDEAVANTRNGIITFVQMLVCIAGLAILGGFVLQLRWPLEVYVIAGVLLTFLIRPRGK